jgi:membrane-bound serine protease (ClpP class)
VLTLAALVVALLFLASPWNWLLVLAAATVDVVETALFIWWSKQRRAAVGVETLVGQRATTVTALAPAGQVRVAGELWEARSASAVDPGQDVVIRAVDGLTLEVEPAETTQEKH